MGYTFLQKPSSFKFLSILEENCGADINNGTIKCKFLSSNVSKQCFFLGRIRPKFGPQFLTAQNLGLQKNLGRSPKMSPTNQNISSLVYDSVYTFRKYSLNQNYRISISKTLSTVKFCNQLDLTTKKMECKSVYN